MKKILEIKSGELQRYKKVNSITKTISIDRCEDQSQFMKRQTMGEHVWHHQHLVNAARAIIQMKPGTAERRHSKHSSRRGKIELLSVARPTDRQVFRNKERQKETNEGDVGGSKEKLGCIFLQIDKRLKSNIKSSKSSRLIKRQSDFDQMQENRHRLESINAKKTVCYKDQGWRQNIEEKQLGVSIKKPKKEKYTTKIPDFIKASLESYERRGKTKQTQKQSSKRNDLKIDEQGNEDIPAEEVKMPEMRIPGLELVTNKKELIRKTKRREDTDRQQEDKQRYQATIIERYITKEKDKKIKSGMKNRRGESVEICGWKEEFE